MALLSRSSSSFELLELLRLYLFVTTLEVGDGLGGVFDFLEDLLLLDLSLLGAMPGAVRRTCKVKRFE